MARSRSGTTGLKVTAYISKAAPQPYANFGGKVMRGILI
jgi:hypothetical protein